MHENFNHIAAIVLAAGKGTRMKSPLPKVLHPICGTPLLGRVIETIKKVGLPHICVVIGGETLPLQKYLEKFQPLTITSQAARLGTGEAVACAGHGFTATKIPPYAQGQWLSGPQITASHGLICAGDTPALDPELLKQFLMSCMEKKSQLAVLAMRHPQPAGYGRIILDTQGQLHAIVEEKDASPQQRTLDLCNSGVIFAELNLLFELLQQLTQTNAQGEYYLTDCFSLARKRGIAADVWISSDFAAFEGVNDRRQLAQLEQIILQRLRERWMLAGVSFLLPSSCYIEDSVQIGENTLIGPHCSLLGQTQIGKNCEIGSHVVLKDVIIADGTKIAAGTIKA